MARRPCLDDLLSDSTIILNASPHEIAISEIKGVKVLTKAGVLFTGGKDSVYALHKAVDSGFNVCVLLSVIPHYSYSMLYHQPNFSVLLAQAQALGLPLESIGVADPNLELNTLDVLVKRAVQRYGLRVLVTGALRSNFQRKAFYSIASKYGLDLYTPHWGLDEYEYMKSLLGYGIEFTVVLVAAMGIPHSIIGKRFTEEDLIKLNTLKEKYGFNLSFEGGEAETLVLDAPLFKCRLEVRGKARTISEFEGYFEIERLRLVKKR